MAHRGTFGGNRESAGNRLFPALCLLLSAVLLVLSGCGRQDRLVPVAPAQPAPLESKPWGMLVDEEAAFLSGGTPHSVAGWSATDYCLGSGDGMVVRIQGDQFRRIRIPGGENVKALHCWPDGTLEAVDWYGRVWLRADEEWSMIHDLARTGCRGVCPDRAGGLWIYGNDGMLVHQSGGAWTDHALPDSLDLGGAWVAPDETVWLVTGRYQVVRLQGDDWTLETLPDSPTYYSTLMIDGSDDGRIAVGIYGSSELWIREEGAWTMAEFEDPADNYLRDLYWQDGELYGVHSYSRMLARWDGAAWVRLVDLPEEIPTYASCRSCALDGGRLLAYDYGQVVHATPSSLEVISPRLGDIAGAAELDGELHVVYATGTHLVRRSDHWQVQEPFPVEGGSLIFDGLGTDSSGGLVAVGNRVISRLQPGQEPTTIATEMYVNRLYRTGEQEALLLYGSDEIMRLEGDSLEQVGTLVGSSPSDLCEDGSGGFYVLDDYLLTQLQGDEERTVQVLSGWQPEALLYDPARGVVLAGDDKVLLLDQDGIHDVTPWVLTISGLHAAEVLDLCLDAEGQWLALSEESDAILRFDGQAWSDTEMDLSAIDALGNWRLTIRPSGSGDYLLFSDELVARLIPGSEGS